MTIGLDKPTYKDSLKELRDAAKARYAANPTSMFARLQSQNLEQAVKDFEQEEFLRAAERSGELLEFKLLGPLVESGTVTLDALFKIGEPFYRAVRCAAYRIRHGFAASKVPHEVSDLLNLRFAGLSPGSARLMITGNAMEDLTGESLLQNTYAHVFHLLGADQDEFYDAVDGVGTASAQALGDMVKAVEKCGLAADIKWISPSRKMHHWSGASAELVRISTLLHSVHEPIEREETLSGEVAGIMDTGRLILRTGVGKTTIRFSKKNTALVQRLSISTPARVRVKARVYYDEVKKAEVPAYTLVGIE